MKIVAWCDRVIKLGFLLLFGLVPLLLTPWNYELFEFNKIMAVYALTVVIAGGWAVKSIAQGELKIAKTPLDVPIVLFVSSQLISSLFSIDPHISWFGYYSRFNGGLLSILSYVVLFYAFVSNIPENIKNQKFPRSGIQLRGTKIKNTNQIVNRKNQSVPLPTIQQFNNLTIFLKVTLATAMVVAFYGVLERLGIDEHLWVQDVQSRVFSTLGQPNWLAAYLVALIPIAMGFALKSQNSNPSAQQGKRHFYWPLGSGFWVLTAVLFFLVLLFTRSRSGLLGFAVADALFWGLTVLTSPRGLRKKLLPPFFLLHFSFFLILFFNGTKIESIDRYLSFEVWKNRIAHSTTQQPAQPAGGFNNVAISDTNKTTYTAPLLESGGTESGTIRKYIWQGAIAAWRSSVKTIAIGTGTETFAWAFFQYRPAGHNLTSEWDFLYNKAHNEYLNYLTTTGILGLGSYLIFIGSFIAWYLRYGVRGMRYTKDQHHTLDVFLIPHNSYLIPPALFAGWISILVTNFFGFSVVVTQIFLFLFPAMVFVHFQQCNNLTIKQRRLPQWIRWIPILSACYVLIILTKYWYADTRFAAGYRAARAGLYSQAEHALTQATQLRGEPLYFDELGSSVAQLTLAAAEARAATTAASLMRQALEASDRAIITSPNNVNFWKTRTKIYYTFSSFDPQFTAAAVEALVRARGLSPNDPKIYYNLAVLWGRVGDNAKAIENLQKATELKANYRDAYWALSLFYTEIGQKQQAQTILREYLNRVDPNDQDFRQRLKE